MTEQEVTKTLEKAFREPTRFPIHSKNNPFYEKTKLSQKNGGTSSQIQFRLYHASLGAGNREFIIHTKTEIALGDGVRYLEPMSDEEVLTMIDTLPPSAIKDIAKYAGIPLKGEKDEVLTKDDITTTILTYHSGEGLKVFYKLQYPVSKDAIRTYPEDKLQLVQEALQPGVAFDPRIVLAMAVQVVHTDSITQPRHVMPYAPHALIVTNSKTGKSTMGKAITGDIPVENATSSNLLGFATADKQVKGKLHGREKPLFIEELNESKTDNLAGSMLAIMEQGEAHQAKGAGGIDCITHSSLCFIANPKFSHNAPGVLQDTILANQFIDTLEKASTNFRAFGSRIAITLFGNDFKTFETKDDIFLQTPERCEQLLISIGEAWKKEFTTWVNNRDIRKWLDQPHRSEYRTALKDLLNASEEIPLREYLEGQLHNHRHLRGAALRLAWLRTGIDLAPIDLTMLHAEKSLELLEDINIESLSKLVKVIPQSAAAIKARKLDNIRQEYFRLFLWTIFEAYNDGHEDAIIPFSTISQYYALAKNQEENLSAKYEHWSGVSAKMLDINHVREEIEKFGLYLNHREKLIIIQDRGLFEEYLEYYNKKNKKGQKGQKGEKGK